MLGILDAVSNGREITEDQMAQFEETTKAIEESRKKREMDQKKAKLTPEERKQQETNLRLLQSIGVDFSVGGFEQVNNIDAPELFKTHALEKSDQVDGYVLIQDVFRISDQVRLPIKNFPHDNDQVTIGVFLALTLKLAKMMSVELKHDIGFCDLIVRKQTRSVAPIAQSLPMMWSSDRDDTYVIEPAKVTISLKCLPFVNENKSIKKEAREAATKKLPVFLRTKYPLEDFPKKFTVLDVKTSLSAIYRDFKLIPPSSFQLTIKAKEGDDSKDLKLRDDMVVYTLNLTSSSEVVISSFGGHFQNLTDLRRRIQSQQSNDNGIANDFDVDRNQADLFDSASKNVLDSFSAKRRCSIKFLVIVMIVYIMVAAPIGWYVYKHYGRKRRPNLHRDDL